MTFSGLIRIYFYLWNICFILSACRLRTACSKKNFYSMKGLLSLPSFREKSKVLLLAFYFEAL